jgi:microcystin degradation protein MlrC
LDKIRQKESMNSSMVQMQGIYEDYQAVPGQADMSTSPKQAVEDDILSSAASLKMPELLSASYEYSPDRYKYYLNKPHQDYLDTKQKVEKLTQGRLGTKI